MESDLTPIIILTFVFAVGMFWWVVNMDGR